MQYIKLGSRGDDVLKWQVFLRGFYPDVGVDLVCDSDFGPMTERATKRFQSQFGLEPDGVVGSMTIGRALLNGFSLIGSAKDDAHGPSWPPRPSWVRLLTRREKERTFGSFEFEPAPTQTNPEGIRIIDGWVGDNIVELHVPQLSRVPSAPKNGVMRVHRLIAPQLSRLWSAWESEKLLDRVLTLNGAFVPRFIRGSRTTLSNHSLGIAFDINAQWNRLGSQGALVGETGCVRELISIAVEYGFFSGLWFTRVDPMHFEAFKVVV